MEVNVQAGKNYCVSCKNACTVKDANGGPLLTLAAGKQDYFKATTPTVVVSDDTATVQLSTARGDAAFCAEVAAAAAARAQEAAQVAVQTVEPFTEHLGDGFSHVYADGRNVLIGFDSSVIPNYTGGTSVAIGSGVPNTSNNVTVGIRAGRRDPEDSNITCVGSFNRCGSDSVSVGSNGGCDANAVLIGTSALGSGNFNVVIGFNAASYGEGGVSIGAFAEATYKDSIAVGRSAVSDSKESVAIGTEAISSGMGISIGAHTCNLEEGCSIGCNALGEATGCVVIGSSAYSDIQNGIAIGYSAGSTAEEGYNECGIAIGGLARSYNTAIAIGEGAEAIFSIGIGSGAYSSADYAIAIGDQTNAGRRGAGECAIAIGYGAISYSCEAIAIGPSAMVSVGTDYGIAIGSTSTSKGGIAIGHFATAANNEVVIKTGNMQFMVCSAGSEKAQQFAGGEACMVFSCVDSAGNPVMARAAKIAELFPIDLLAMAASTPATMGLRGRAVEGEEAEANNAFVEAVLSLVTEPDVEAARAEAKAAAAVLVEERKAEHEARLAESNAKRAAFVEARRAERRAAAAARRAELEKELAELDDELN